MLAFEAGADLILMPADAEAALDGLEEAVLSGRISRARLQKSLDRREHALERCTPSRNTTLEEVVAELSTLVTPEDLQLAAELVSLSLEQQGEGRLPDGPGLNLIRVDTQLNTPQLPAMAPALLRPSVQGYRALVLDGRSPSPWCDNPEAPLALDRLPPGPVLLQLLVRGNPFRGSAGGDEPWPQVVRQLLSVGRLAGLAVYGSPYLWEQLRVLLPPDLPAAYSPGQIPQAQAHLLSALGIEAAALEGGFTD